MSAYIFYGGAFDPLTLAHERIIQDLWHPWNRLIIGVTDRDYKPSLILVKDRMGMVRRFCSSLPAKERPASFRIVRQQGPTYAFLRSRHPEVDTLAVGTDELVALIGRAWAYADRLIYGYKLLSFPRYDAISSRAVRKLMAGRVSREELLQYVDESVYGWLKANGYIAIDTTKEKT